MPSNLLKLRTDKGLSQKELSELSGVSRTIISGLESGRTEVTTTSTLAKLAKALEVEVSAFF